MNAENKFSMTMREAVSLRLADKCPRSGHANKADAILTPKSVTLNLAQLHRSFYSM